jgi:hypothetical protein
MSLVFYIKTVFHTEVILAQLARGRLQIMRPVATSYLSTCAHIRTLQLLNGNTLNLILGRHFWWQPDDKDGHFTRTPTSVSNRNDHACCTDCNDTRKCCVENETLLIRDEMLEQKERNASELSYGAFITSRAVKPRYSATVQSPHYLTFRKLASYI